MSQGSPPDADRAAPEGDISLGRELRRAREVRGISIQQIAQETKINERYIHALENDRFDLLPGQPYTANFVRSIARTIGADEEELIDYLNYHLRVLRPEGRDDLRAGAPQRARPGLPAVLAVGAVLVIVALTIALKGGSSDRERPRDARPTSPAVSGQPLSAPVAATALPGTAPGAPTTPAPGLPSAVRSAPAVLGSLAIPSAPAPALPSAPEVAPAPSAPSAPAPATAAEEPAPTVRLVWRARAWVDTFQEGDLAPRLGMRDAGDEMTWNLDRPLTLKIGNAGKVDLYIDGQLAKPLGSDTETRKLQLDRKNWRALVR